jgi:hypothetical protein
MDEIIVEAAGGGVGQWLKLVSAVIVGLGGAAGILELIKYLFSLRAHRRKDNAEAKKEEASAGQQDAELREKELHVLNQIADAAKAQLYEWKQAYADVKAEREALKADKEEDRRIKSELRMELAKVKRQCNGVQETLNLEIAARRSAERLYCDNEACLIRHPPKGTYHSGDKLRTK